MGRNAKPDMTPEQHAESIKLDSRGKVRFAIFAGVELAALHKNAGETPEVSGMETLLADLVQQFCFNGVGNAGTDLDLTKSTAVIKLLMDEALATLAEAGPPVCNLDSSALRAIDGPNGKVLLCMTCGDSQPVTTTSEQQNWKLAYDSQNKPPADEPTAAPEKEDA